jgi:hypothetical protein
LADEDVRSAAQSASRAEGESGARGGTIAVTFVILSALLIGPLFVIFSILRTGPFATGSLANPAALVPSSGAYFGAFVGSRGEDRAHDAATSREYRM